MLRYVARRLGLGVLTVFGVSVVVFLIMRILPGDPLVAVLGSDGMQRLTEEQRTAYLTDLGLNAPLYQQYLGWMGDILRGDFGRSFFRSESVADMILRRGPLTAQIAALSVLLSWVVGIPVAIISALRPNSVADGAVRFLSIFFLAVPGFWLGMLIVLGLLFAFGYRAPLTGADLLTLSQLQTSVTLKELANTGNQNNLTPAFFACLSDGGGTGASNAAYAGNLADAQARAQALAQANGMQLSDFAQWKALDMAGDFVRIANAGDLAFADMPAQRASQYKLLAQALANTNASVQMSGNSVSNANTLADLFKARFKPLMAIMLKLAAGAPSEHIRLDLTSNSIVDLSNRPSPF